MIHVMPNEFSRIMHNLGFTNSDAVPGLLHDPKNGKLHTAFIDRDGSYAGDIIAETATGNIAHHVKEKYIKLLKVSTKRI